MIKTLTYAGLDVQGSFLNCTSSNFQENRGITGENLIDFIWGFPCVILLLFFLALYFWSISPCHFKYIVNWRGIRRFSLSLVTSDLIRSSWGWRTRVSLFWGEIPTSTGGRLVGRGTSSHLPCEPSFLCS